MKRLNLPPCFATAILFASALTPQPDELIRLHADNPHARKPPAELAEFFAPPEQYRSDVGNFRSPLVFADGTRVRRPADWQRRREEILSTWHNIMGPWPPLIDR